MVKLDIVYGEQQKLEITENFLGENGRISLNQSNNHLTISVNTDKKLGLQEPFNKINGQKITKITIFDNKEEVFSLDSAESKYEINWNVILTARYYEENLMIEYNFEA